MPIAIDNGLPHLVVTLGLAPATSFLLSGPMDTCGALNTGYLPYHQWVMSEHPTIVTEYSAFNDTNPFEPVKLGGAIRDPDDFDATNHGNLTAVIRYHTPYLDPAGAPVTLSFALGMDVTVNCIFGLPMLCALDSVISLTANILHSRTLNHDFPITRAAAVVGLPPDCPFDADAARRSFLASSLTSRPGLPTPSFQTVLATASDDHSHGFLRRSVHPTS
jgi:hypothetical protein